MALYKKLDLWSITDGLDRMMDYCYNGNEKSSPYWGADQRTEHCGFRHVHRAGYPEEPSLQRDAL